MSICGESGAGAATESMAAHGYPFVVKPVDTAASFGVRLVNGPGEARDTWESLTRLRGSTDHQFAHYFPIGDFIMEEYLEGPEYSIESLSFDGRHVILAITEKLTGAGFIEYGHALPANLAPADETALRDCVTTFLDALEFRHGPAHTEAKLTARGPRIVESHGRPGGDRIPDLVRAVYGLDIETYTLGRAAGVMSLLEVVPGPGGGRPRDSLRLPWAG